MATARVFLAGIGSSPWSWLGATLPALKTSKATFRLALSACTKALLDAGLSYDNVDHAIGSTRLSGSNEVFYTLGQTGIPLQQADDSFGIHAAAQLIRAGGADCVLVVSFDESAAVGAVLTSDRFLWRHPYLKDSALEVRGCALGTPNKVAPIMNLIVKDAVRTAGIGPKEVQLVESNAKSALDELEIPRNVPTWSAATSLQGLCELAWLLRGWKKSEVSPLQNCLQCTAASNGTATAIILARADGKPAPSLADVEHKNDGRDRLGYNPANRTQEITMEDWEAVRSRPEYAADQAGSRVRFRRKGGDRAALEKL